ncbi:MAG: hypothetical protein HY042_02115, partial [Spirochaetia bacterium]|nr:hypothetical protein [Spirochaetia bacterium]
MKTNLYIPAILCLAFAASSVLAQDKPDLSKAEALLKADVTAAKQEISKMSAEEAAVMISQMRHVAA